MCPVAADRKRSIMSASKVSISHLGTGDAVFAPHLHDLTTIFEDHDRLPSIRAHVAEHFALDLVVGTVIAILAHVKRTKELEREKPILGLFSAAFGTTGGKNDRHPACEVAREHDHGHDWGIEVAGIEEGIPVLGLPLDQRKPVGYISQGTVDVEHVTALHVTPYLARSESKSPSSPKIASRA